MLTVNNLMKPQVMMQKYYFISNLGEILYDSSEATYEKRHDFMRNYGGCRVTKISEYNHTIHFTFNLPQCPIFDMDCPYAYTDGLSCQCMCSEPYDNCDEMASYVNDIERRNYRGE